MNGSSKKLLRHIPMWTRSGARAPDEKQMATRTAHSIKKLIIAGIQTELCVDTTCRQACSLEYDVTLVKDAHSTWDRELLTAPQIIAHHNALLSDWFVTTKDERDILFEDDLASPN